jgi:hypothetical protein
MHRSVLKRPPHVLPNRVKFKSVPYKEKTKQAEKA